MFCSSMLTWQVRIIVAVVYTSSSVLNSILILVFVHWQYSLHHRLTDTRAHVFAVLFLLYYSRW